MVVYWRNIGKTVVSDNHRKRRRIRTLSNLDTGGRNLSRFARKSLFLWFLSQEWSSNHRETWRPRGCSTLADPAWNKSKNLIITKEKHHFMQKAAKYCYNIKKIIKKANLDSKILSQNLWVDKFLWFLDPGKDWPGILRARLLGSFPPWSTRECVCSFLCSGWGFEGWRLVHVRGSRRCKIFLILLGVQSWREGGILWMGILVLLFCREKDFVFYCLPCFIC